MSDRYDTLVVGAGYAGSIMAERFAAERGQRVLVIDRRDHIAGNAYDYVDEHGVLRPRLRAAHLPHELRAGRGLPLAVHRVAALRAPGGRARSTASSCRCRSTARRSTSCTGSTCARRRRSRRSYAERRRARRAHPDQRGRRSSPRSGRDLYETLFRGYTRKQWAARPRPSCTPRSARGSRSAPTPTTATSPTRFQKMPADGYTAMFERMLDHPNIDVRLETDSRRSRDEVEHRHLVYTGPIDVFFDHRFGELPYRSPASSSCATSRRPTAGSCCQPASVNHPSEDVPYTRVTEFRHLTGPGARPELDTRGRVPPDRGRPVLPDPPRRDPRALPRYEALAGSPARRDASSGASRATST